MSNDFLFSIITINYNDVDGVRRTSKSIAEQTFKNFQWIFIDGNSSDGSQESASEIDIHNKIIVSEPDSGIYDAMNKGITRSASGSYLLFLNSGDIFIDDHVLQNVALFLSNLRHPPDVLFGDSKEVTSFGARNKKCKPFYYLNYGMITHHQSVFFRKSNNDLLKYDVSYKLAADYALICLLYKDPTCSFLIAPITICLFDMPGASHNFVVESRAEAKRVRRDILKQNLLLLRFVELVQSIMFFVKVKSGFYPSKG